MGNDLGYTNMGMGISLYLFFICNADHQQHDQAFLEDVHLRTMLAGINEEDGGNRRGRRKDLGITGVSASL